MIHDHLCPQGSGASITTTDGLGDFPCLCDLIARVREDERRRWDGQSVVLASTIKQEGEQG